MNEFKLISIIMMMIESFDLKKLKKQSLKHKQRYIDKQIER